MNNRIEWVDTAKGIGLILVILGHLSIPYVDLWVYLFHMPLFFFLSGFVFSGDKYNFKDYFVRKFKSLIIPYFFLGAVIYLFYVIVNMVLSPEVCYYGTNLQMLWGFIKQEAFWTVWFLTCLFLIEIIYYFINKLAKIKFWLVTIASLIVCVLGLLRYHFGLGALPWNLDIAFVAQFFFHIGHSFRKWTAFREGLLSKKGFVFLVLVAALLCVNVVVGFAGLRLSGEALNMSAGMYGNELLTFISAFAGIMLTVLVSNKIHSKFLTYLGKNTMIIFAWHSRIVIVLCDYIYEAAGVFSDDSMLIQCGRALVSFVVILALLIPITELIRRTKIHAWFGV